jgi:hypothetical protein
MKHIDERALEMKSDVNSERPREMALQKKALRITLSIVSNSCSALSAVDLCDFESQPQSQEIAGGIGNCRNDYCLVINYRILVNQY